MVPRHCVPIALLTSEKQMRSPTSAVVVTAVIFFQNLRRRKILCHQVSFQWAHEAKISLCEFRVVRRVTKKFQFEFPNCLPGCTRCAASEFIVQLQHPSSKDLGLFLWIDSAELRSSMWYYWLHRAFESREAVGAVMGSQYMVSITLSTSGMHWKRKSGILRIVQFLTDILRQHLGSIFQGLIV